MKPRKKFFGLKPELLLLYIIVLGIFALYAGSLQLVAAHDDVVNLDVISQRSLLQLFDLAPYGTGYYRPMSFVPWAITRGLFGWYQPAILHAWNLFCQVLNTVLVGVLAARLGRLFGIRSRALPVIAALVFGLFPFNYQAVLWAGALPHPLATFFGLMALHAYLTWRRGLRRETRIKRPTYLIALSAILLIAASLSAEEGIVFGVFLCLIELVSSVQRRQRPSLAALFLTGMSLAYAPIYLWFIRPSWMHISGQTPSSNLNDILTSFVYQAQGMVAWVVILLRPIVGLPSYGQTIILLALGAVCLVGLILLWVKRMLSIGLIGLGWWVVAIIPSLILLSPDYVLTSPRLMYIASVGVALFNTALIVACLHLLRRPIIQVAFLVLLAPLFIWGATHISTWVTEVARVPAALRVIDRDVRTSDPASKVLLINTPAWEAPAVPSFFVGIESIPIYRSKMLAAVSDTQREEQSVRHDISLTHNDSFTYVPYGDVIDDTALRIAILASDRIYKFDYDDPPGVRARLIGTIDRNDKNVAILAQYTRGSAQATINAAQATQCGEVIQVSLTWSGVKNITEPVSVFVHGQDAAGQQVVVADFDLLDGYLPLDQVPPGVMITETRLINLPSNAAQVDAVSVGVYTRSDVQRLHTQNADGTHLEGDALNVPVRRNAAACR